MARGAGGADGGLGTVIFGIGACPVTTGFIVIPLFLGVGSIFDNSRMIWGWVKARADATLVGRI